MTRGHRGSLLLRCRALSSPSPCRFIPAHTTTSGPTAASGTSLQPAECRSRHTECSLSPRCSTCPRSSTSAMNQRCSISCKQPHEVEQPGIDDPRTGTGLEDDDVQILLGGIGQTVFAEGLVAHDIAAGDPEAAPADMHHTGSLSSWWRRWPMVAPAGRTTKWMRSISGEPAVRSWA
jgi:hypothetical protein